MSDSSVYLSVEECLRASERAFARTRRYGVHGRCRCARGRLFVLNERLYSFFTGTAANVCETAHCCDGLLMLDKCARPWVQAKAAGACISARVFVCAHCASCRTGEAGSNRKRILKTVVLTRGGRRGESRQRATLLTLNVSSQNKSLLHFLQFHLWGWGASRKHTAVSKTERNMRPFVFLPKKKNHQTKAREKK